MASTGLKLKPVSATELAELVKKPTPRGRTSKGQELVEQFLASGETAATIDFPSDKGRNGVSLSASNFVRQTGSRIWIRKTSPTQLLLVNLTKAPADVVKAYDGRPRVGRKAAAKKR